MTGWSGCLGRRVGLLDEVVEEAVQGREPLQRDVQLGELLLDDRDDQRGVGADQLGTEALPGVLPDDGVALAGLPPGPDELGELVLLGVEHQLVNHVLHGRRVVSGCHVFLPVLHPTSGMLLEWDSKAASG